VLDNIPGRDLNWLKAKTGLPISTYFTAFKLKWLLDNEPKIQRARDAGTLRFGTVDSWILWNLTGGKVHATDVTNASRTFLMDIESLEWDGDLLRFFNIPSNILPTIHASSHMYGTIQIAGPLERLPITGIIGDQNAALVGQQCFGIGQAKVTYGTGCFLIQNIGPAPLHAALKMVSREARKQLITTVAYKFGDNPPCYALEGSVAIAGAAITWLRDNLQLINSYAEIETIAGQSPCSGGLFFVPALQGLYAPYWDANATGTIIGVSQFSRKSHFVRATLEGVAFQANDIILMMNPSESAGIKVDGGMASNDMLCQFLANISGYEIIRPKLIEATALGVALVAGYTLKLWPELERLINAHCVEPEEPYPNSFIQHGDHEADNDQSWIKTIKRRLSMNEQDVGGRQRVQNATEVSGIFQQSYDRFQPALDEIGRLNRINSWKMAVERSRNWIRVEKQEQRRANYSRLSALPFMTFLLVSFGAHIFSTLNI